jgi:2Fe-2S ferredoxin
MESDMVGIVLVDRAGAEHPLDLAEKRSQMEGIREAGFDELLALCGGGCACATCHVYLENVEDGQVDALTEDESDLLDSSENRRQTSRLACQVQVSDALKGARVTIVAE